MVCESFHAHCNSNFVLSIALDCFRISRCTRIYTLVDNKVLPLLLNSVSAARKLKTILYGHRRIFEFLYVDELKYGMKRKMNVAELYCIAVELLLYKTVAASENSEEMADGFLISTRVALYALR